MRGWSAGDFEISNGRHMSSGTRPNPGDAGHPEWPRRHTMDSGPQGCVRGFIVSDTRPTLEGTPVMGGCARGGRGCAWEVYVPFPQLCCEPKTAPKR